MTTETKIAPQNSLLLVMDKDSGEIPELMNGKPVAATDSCIVVGTLSEGDGETSVMLTDDKIQVYEIPSLHKAFSAVLATPNRRVDICTVLLQPVLTFSVSNTKSHIEIWANNETEPDKLCVLVLDGNQ